MLEACANCIWRKGIYGETCYQEKKFSSFFLSVVFGISSGTSFQTKRILDKLLEKMLFLDLQNDEVAKQYV